MKELIFSDSLAGPRDGRLNGPCNLPASINWPCDPEGAPLFHLMSIPLDWLEELKSTEDPKSLWISVFVSFDPAGFSHYSKMSTDEVGHSDAAVILHDMSGQSARVNAYQAIASKAISISAAIDGDDNVASHIGFEASWLQDPLKIDGYEWRMSVYGPDMDEFLGSNAGIFSGGSGYLFLKSDLDVKSFGIAGKFFLQI